MLLRYRRNGVGRLEQAAEAGEDVVWIDLDRPTPEEIRDIEAACGIQIPPAEALRRIETSDQLYRDGGLHYMIVSTVVPISAPLLERSHVCFITAGHHLVTVHYGSPKGEPLFARFAAAAAKDPSLSSSHGALIGGLADSLVERLSGMLEKLEAEVEALTLVAFGEDPAEGRRTLEQTRSFRVLLRRVGRKGNTIAKIRQSLHSIGRMLAYLGASDLAESAPEAKLACQQLLTDVKGLQELAGSIQQNVTFLLDASLGMISIEQNIIIKLFTVISGAFLPPTLIGTLYGMNFKVMPELDWTFGYPAALLLMVASAVLPLAWFRRKGWF